MRNTKPWQQIGWRHELWGLVRYYRSLRGQAADQWLARLQQNGKMDVGTTALTIAAPNVELLSKYIEGAKTAQTMARGALRTEAEALAFCEDLGATVLTTKTRSKDHHQSSKALIAAVSAIATKACTDAGTTVETDPQRRLVWATSAGLHVSARNLDGAVPTLVNPTIVWEIKEYWGVTSGGSKMSDAVYECQLVGREIREYEEHSKTKIIHIVFLDGQAQWLARMSDLLRFIDLEHQGLIDHLPDSMITLRLGSSSRLSPRLSEYSGADA